MDQPNYELSILAAATIAAGGDAERAKVWFHSEKLAPFRGATASQLVEIGRGADVLKYVESLSAGPLG